jgi:hypothetical protein
MTFIGLLHCALVKTSPTKDYGPVILGLVAMGWNTSFTILLEHLPSQLEIAGLLQSSTPSCKDSQVNLTWLKCLNYRYIVLVYGILEYPYTWLKPKVLLPPTDSLHHLTSPYYSFGWLKFNKLSLVYFFQWDSSHSGCILSLDYHVLYIKYIPLPSFMWGSNDVLQLGMEQDV